MTPQDTRSPFQQQRFIELENVGSVEIPAFGACEVTDSYRPEQTGGYTPDGGRTVLKVRQAETSNPRLSCINGPCPIPAGKSGRVGTMDDPMLAQVYSSAYTAGTDVGIKSGSFKLEEGYTGYRIIGDYDATTDTMRVIRQPESTALVECCLAEDHPGYGVVFTVKLMVWDSANNGHKPDPNDTDTHYAIDWRYGTPYPDAGLRGLFIKRRGTCNSVAVDMYEVVLLDCEPPEIDGTEAEVAACP